MVENRLVRIEVKIEVMEKAIEKTVDILAELVESKVANREMEKRITKLENALNRLNWIVITAVVGALTGLVIK